MAESLISSDYILLSKEEKLKKGVYKESVIDLVDSFLTMGINYSVSDIHFEPTEIGMRVRYRVDGVLYDQGSFEKEKALALVSRLKILSSLDIAEKRVPQDGKFRVRFEENNLIDMRVSTFPTIYGEKLVIRILDKSKNDIQLDNLGMNNQTLSELSHLINRPYGFFLITGPTGSGKTTTLYSILSYLNDNKKNIVTMEDPVEYNLDGITQSQINDKAGFSFENGLRSILRQDPDVIMVGEIRDKQTANIALEAALTGHLVFSTLHTNDTASAVTRLVDMGVEPFLINAALSGVIAQRLVRKLCDKCKQKDFLTIEEKSIITNQGVDLNKFVLNEIYRPCGCSDCFDLGYKGRTGIFELLKINDELRNIILTNVSASEIKKTLEKNNTSFLFHDALEKMKQGLISYEEFLKIIIK